jgi:hypothetical protein
MWLSTKTVRPRNKIHMIDPSTILYTSCQLCELDAARQPLAVGSGCLVRLPDTRLLLLTVSHVTGNQGNWSIQLGYDKTRGPACYQIGALNYIARLTLPDASATEVDFSYALVPSDLQAFREELTPDGQITAQNPVAIFDFPTEATPTAGDSFGFAGTVLAAMKPNPLDSSRPILASELRAYSGLSYVRREGDFHVFGLPFPHPGHEHFQGCSGAPIISSMGIPVGLVSSGRTDTHEVYGLALDHYLPILLATL